MKALPKTPEIAYPKASFITHQNTTWLVPQVAHPKDDFQQAQKLMEANLSQRVWAAHLTHVLWI